jgi:hypothetical protein
LADPQPVAVRIEQIGSQKSHAASLPLKFEISN